MASKLSKKHLFALSGTAAAVMLLAGCGASESSDDNVAAYKTNTFGVEFSRPGNQVASAVAASDGRIYIVGDALTGSTADSVSAQYLNDFAFTNSSGENSYALRQYVSAGGQAAFKIIGDNFFCGMEQPPVEVRPNGELSTVITDVEQTLKCAATEVDAGTDILYDFSSAANYTFLFSYQVTDGTIDFDSFRLTITDQVNVDVPPLALPIYVRGTLNNWEVSDEYQLSYLGNNVYGVEANFDAGTAITYKVAAEDWNAGGSYNCGAAGLSIGGNAVGECGPTSPDISVTFDTAGKYLFSVDYSESASPVFALTLVEAIESHPFGVNIGSGASNILYFVSPELTDGVARTKAQFKLTEMADTYSTEQVRLGAGSYTFYIQDPSGKTVYSSDTSLTANIDLANPGAGENTSVDGIDLMLGVSPVTLNVQQAGDYYFGLDRRNGNFRLGVFYNQPVYCEGTCSPDDFGDVLNAPSSDEQTADIIAELGGRLFIRGDLTGWDARVGSELTQVSEGVYSVVVPALKDSDYVLKIADAAWGDWADDSVVPYNCGFKEGVEVEDTEGNVSTVENELQLDVVMLLDCESDNPAGINVNIESQTDYLFTFGMGTENDPNQKTLTISKYVPFDPGLGIYLRGGMNDWAALDSYLMSNNFDVYALTISGIEGAQNFKFADNDWGSSSELNYGLSEGEVLALGTPVSLTSGAGDIGFTFDSSVNYSFILDMAGYAVGAGFQPSLLITETVSDIQLCLKGTMSEWDCIDGYKFQSLGDGRYFLKAEIPAGEGTMFKFADAVWGEGTNVNFGPVEPAAFDGSDGTYAIVSGSNDNFIFTSEGGEYLFMIDLRGFEAGNADTIEGDYSFTIKKVTE